jgi:hypothetical protein
MPHTTHSVSTKTTFSPRCRRPWQHVDTLQGGQNLGEIDDLKYFNNKMARGLRVPSSYLPTGPDDSDRAMNDGKVGTALDSRVQIQPVLRTPASIDCAEIRRRIQDVYEMAWV